MPSGYPESEDDFIAMQQEAIRRVRDMQARARATLEQAGMHIEGGAPESGDAPGGEASAQSEAPPESDGHRGDGERRESPSGRPGGIRGGNFRGDRAPRPESGEAPGEPEEPGRPGGAGAPPPPGPGLPPSHSPLRGLGLNISLESDQLILLVLMYLLFRDNGDRWLLLALGYIFL